MAGLSDQDADAGTASPTVSTVKRGTPLYEQIYDALWDLIFKGEIQSGQRLSDREWAERLSTSRTPVREAMRQMARDGVLIVLENGGYQVRTVDPQGLANLYRCRAPLAALADFVAPIPPEPFVPLTSAPVNATTVRRAPSRPLPALR